jgi:GT2 family glycosyltransferase
VADITVVIGTLGNYSGLGRVLDGYERQHVEPGRFDVIVVSDAAEPDMDAVARTIGERTYPVAHLQGGRPGLSANRNRALAERSVAGLVLFTDNDTIPEPQLLAEHLSWHDRHPEADVAILGHVRWAREVKVTPFMRWLDHGIQFDYPNIEGVEAGWGRFYGANVSLKTEFARSVGGFDEERLPYLYDDLDFGYRASKLGMRLFYNRAAVVEHLREIDLDFFRQRMDRAARAERAFVRKHPEIPPYFHDLYSQAAEAPAASGRGRWLIGWLPRWIPILGERAWRSADLWFKQQVAGEFLAAWNADAGRAEGGPVAPYLLERDAVNSGGSEPSGPK